MHISDVRFVKSAQGAFIGATVVGDDGHVAGVIPYDVEGAEALVKRFGEAVGELRAHDALAAETAAQKATQSDKGIEVGGRVEALVGSVRGRKGTVKEIEADGTVVVCKVEGMMQNEELRLRPDAVRAL